VADELRETFGVESTLIAGGGGVFVVTVDGERVFDNGKTGRFPRVGEVSGVIGGR
jgi:predicted Rdx family selenoprotein